MGQSTDGQIGYGIVFEEGFEFPWGDEDMDDWWLKECGYKPSVEIYGDTESGYANNVRPDQKTIDAYYDEKKAFKDSHPLPVKLENYCHCDCPMYMLVVPSSAKQCSRGYPKEFDPQKLTVTEEEKKALLDFCQKYNLTGESGPAWFLTSYWG